MQVLLRTTATLVVLLTLYWAMRGWIAARNEALVILAVAAVVLTGVLGLQSLVSLQKEWPKSSGASPQRKQREQRYFGLRRPTLGGRHWRSLVETETRLIEQYGEDAISHLQLSVPTFNQLKAAKLVRISELMTIFAEDPEGALIYARCRLFGSKKMAELKEKLDAYLDRQAADPQIKI